jgi:hypothetical protein
VEAVRRARFADTRRDLREATEEAVSPELLADRVFEAVAEERFYILADDWVGPAMERRVRDMLEGRDPGTNRERPEEQG